MPADHVETLRRLYERWEIGDFGGTEIYDEHVVLVLRHDFPEAGAHHGRDGISAYMRNDFLKDFVEATIAGVEFIDAGDSVVVRVDQQATGPRSGVPVRMSYFQVWTFRGDSVIRLESIMSRSDALAAVGLSE